MEWIEELVGKRHIELRIDSGVTVMAREKRDCREGKMRFKKDWREKSEMAVLRDEYYGVLLWLWQSNTVWYRHDRTYQCLRKQHCDSLAPATCRGILSIWIFCFISGYISMRISMRIYTHTHQVHLSQRPHWLLLTVTETISHHRGLSYDFFSR